jgi:hypothetical protein
VDRKKDGEQARGGVYRREGGVHARGGVYTREGGVYRELVRPAAIAIAPPSVIRGDGQRQRCRIKT